MLIIKLFLSTWNNIIEIIEFRSSLHFVFWEHFGDYSIPDVKESIRQGITSKTLGISKWDQV